MGSAQSSQERGGGGEEEDDNEAEEDEEEEEERERLNHSKKKVLEQEPEMLLCHASASPLSPQLSTVGTPRLLGGPSIKVWDPCNVLGPPAFSRSFGPSEGYGDVGDRITDVYLICHGECGVSLRPDLVVGRWPAAGLTGNGQRQARALAVFLNSQGISFNEVYCSPLDRARATATSVCRELDFAAEQIQSSDALVEMSHGQWEGCLRSEVYSPEMLSLIERTQPDFSAPSGESLRQVEFRMIEFLNRTVLRMPNKLHSGEMLLHQNESKDLSHHDSSNSIQDRDGPILPHWDLLHRHRQGMTRKKSGKSRLQFVTKGDNETEDEYSTREANHGQLLHDINARNPSFSVGVFTHSIPIKCLLTGLLHCSPVMSHKICIDDSSLTVLQHSLRAGWKIKRLNDTAHLRLL